MKRFVLLCAVAVSVAPLAEAQPARPAPGPAPAAPPAPGPLETPPMPDVKDAMLADLPAAPHVLANWQQALTMIRNSESTLRIARAQVESVQGVARQTLSRSLPSLTGTANLTHHLLYGRGFNFNALNQFPPPETTIPDPGTTWQAGLGLRVPLLNAQAWYDYGTGRRRVEAARLSAKDAERLAVAVAADSIVTVVTTERLAEVSRVSLRSALSTLDLTTRRANLGASSAVDVLRSEQEVALTRAQVVAADEDARRAREALGAALGSDQPWGVTPAIRLDSLAQEAKSACRPEPSIDDRPDVRAARANLKVSERDVNSVDWSFVPTVDFVSNLTYLSVERASPNREHVTWTIGGVLSWPLYDGGLRYGVRKAAQGESRVAREQLTQTKREARFQVAQAFRGVQVADSNLTVSRRSRDIASESARLSKIAFLNGSGTSFDLVDTARRLREAELDLAIKEFEVVRAKVTALLALATCDV